MADGMYVGMSGAVARAEQLDAIADNLANGQTPGFTQQHAGFEAFLPAGNNPEKTYTAAVSHGTDLTPGALSLTGNPLDLAAKDGAFFQVRQADGSTAFTRDGRVHVGAEGQLHIGEAQLLDRTGDPISVAPGTLTSIDATGAVLSNGEPIAQLGLFTLSGQLDRLGGSLLAAGPNGAAHPVESGVQVGALSLSNARPLDAAVQMVTAQRHFETSMQAIQTYRRLDERANELGRIR